MSKILLGTLKYIVTKAFTEKVLTKLVIYIAEHLAAKSTNKLDDKIVGELKAALEE
ncbi:hypothetical protein [Marinomonas atlantica]|uniref:hypothetical protein n=1 Tax=Marinomonas atlantica TaxID=1806668 RepID=UPI000A63BF7A|nr:hypothetical protein [Marinomonas atlantica]